MGERLIIRCQLAHANEDYSVCVRCDALIVVSTCLIALIQAKPGHCFSERNQDLAAARLFLSPYFPLRIMKTNDQISCTDRTWVAECLGFEAAE